MKECVSKSKGIGEYSDIASMILYALHEARILKLCHTLESPGWLFKLSVYILILIPIVTVGVES